MHDNKNLKITGKGWLDGQGFMWWIREFLQKNIHRRPNMVSMERCVDLEWEGLSMKNSPRYHVQPRAVNSYWHDFEIYVDIVGIF
jgi:polygalacturonase